MANVDNLNFKVILDDKDFSSRVEKDIELAKKLNTSLSSLLDAKRKVSNAPNVKISKADEMNVRRMAKMAESTDKAALAQQKLATESERTAKAAANASNAQERLKRSQMQTEQMSRRITAQTERQNRAYQSQGRILNELKGYALGYLSIHGASQLLSSLVRVTGEFELQKTTLSAMLGDLNAAEGIITRIQGLAVESPFQFKELTTYAKQLSAFSVPAQELYDTTKMLADISAGLGVGMDRIVLAYGQVRSAAFLRGQEVRQFTEAGIPILDELAKQFSELEGRAVSAGEVFDKISARLVPFEMVAKVFKDMTSEGGKFYNMQEIQAETLRGKISNLKDAYEIMLNEIGKGQSENLKGAVDWARKLMTNYEETGRVLVELVAAYGTYRATLAITTNLQSTLARNLVVLRREFRAFTSMLSANPYALLAAGITAVGFGLYKATTSLEDYEKIQRAVTDTQKDFSSRIATETSKLDSLYAKLRVAKEGTEEYAEARKQIYTQYSSYISELESEGVAINNLASIYDNLKEKITASAQARYRMTAEQGVEDEYAQGMDALYKRFELLSKNMGNSIKRELMEVEKEALWQYLLGDENALNIPEAEGIRGIATDMGTSGYGYLVEKAKGEAKLLIDTYANAKKRIDDLFGKEAPSTGGQTPFIYPSETEQGESPADKVQAEIDAVRRLKDAYDTLAPYMNGDMLRKTLTALFPNADQDLIRSLDFRGKLVELAAELNKFDQEASQKLLDSISGEKASEIASAFKAIETYKNMLDSWLGEDFNLTGEGVAFDISKIIRDLNNQYAKINQKAIQANDLLTKAQMGDEEALATVREVYGEDVWQKYLINGKETIEELARLEREAAKKTADDKIRNLADASLKERMADANISLTDFDDKTISQVQEMIKRMKEIRTEIYDERNKLYKGGVTEEEIPFVEELDAELEKLKVILADLGIELEKKVIETVGVAMSSISDMGGTIEGLGDAIGSSNIAEFGRELSRVAEGASSIVNALQSKDTIALIANIASFAISSIANVISATTEQQRILNEAAYEYRDIMSDIRRESYSGIFGTDEMGLAAENAEILADAQKNYQSVLSKFNEVKLRSQKKDGDYIHFGKMSVADIMEDLASEQGWDLYLANGELNIDALEAYYDAYADRLTKKQKAMVDEIIASGNAVDDAMTQSAEYITSLFSSVADNIAESMIDAFLESGDAAINMGDVISDVSRQMVTDLIKSIYLMPILNDYAEQLAAIDRDSALNPTQATEQKLAILETALSEIAGQSDAITETIERFEDYLGAGESGTTDLGEGIKGITEDQANLLASYLNAIRADVSYSKTLWVKMDANLQRIADMFTSSPTLMEYQAQIAANTYNTAIATQEILSQLRSVVTTDSGDSAIRVYS